jgi:hypothetical protein
MAAPKGGVYLAHYLNSTDVDFSPGRSLKTLTSRKQQQRKDLRFMRKPGYKTQNLLPFFLTQFAGAIFAAFIKASGDPERDLMM